MSFIDEIKARAKQNRKTIVLPEAEDIRTLQAAAKVQKEDIADLVLIGKEEDVKKLAGDLDISKVKIVNPETDPNFDKYVDILVECRKKKGMTKEEAEKILKTSYTYYGVVMVKAGDVDGMVSGACHSTADTLRPSLQILKTAPGTKLVSSFFVLAVPNCDLGAKGKFVFSDC